MNQSRSVNAALKKKTHTFELICGKRWIYDSGEEWVLYYKTAGQTTDWIGFRLITHDDPDSPYVQSLKLVNFNMPIRSMLLHFNLEYIMIYSPHRGRPSI